MADRTPEYRIARGDVSMTWMIGLGADAVAAEPADHTGAVAA